MVDPITFPRILIAELYNESSVFNWDAITILVLVIVNIYFELNTPQLAAVGMVK